MLALLALQDLRSWFTGGHNVRNKAQRKKQDVIYDALANQSVLARELCAHLWGPLIGVMTRPQVESIARASRAAPRSVDRRRNGRPRNCIIRVLGPFAGCLILSLERTLRFL